MKIRHNVIFDATQYNKRGDHKLESVTSVSVPILDELPGEENKWPNTGHLGTIDQCNPKDLRYAIRKSADLSGTSGAHWFDIVLTDWILEVDGSIVGVISNEAFKNKYEVTEE